MLYLAVEKNKLARRTRYCVHETTLTSWLFGAICKQLSEFISKIHDHENRMAV